MNDYKNYGASISKGGPILRSQDINDAWLAKINRDKEKNDEEEYIILFWLSLIGMFVVGYFFGLWAA